ncbi:MAG: hypothetical protein NVS9B10_20360 [Nevskia sp.]
MKPSTRGKRIQQIINALLIVIVIGAIAKLSTRYKFEADWTYGHRNTLTAGSQKLLASLKDEVHVLVFDYPNSANRGDIQAWVERYQRFKKDIRLEWVDPGADPARVKKYDVGSVGEVVLEYQQRHESLRQLSEATITEALQRLSDSGEHYIVFLEGHGERNPVTAVGNTQNDITQLGDALKGKGLKVQTLNLVKTPAVPDNASVLVIASPTKTLLEGEEKLIADYVERGGNLLWLTDPEIPPGLPALSKQLAVTWQNGFVIFADYAALGSPNPGVFLATDYPPNEVTGEFKDVTAFPLARSIGIEADPTRRNGWTPVPIVQTNTRAWLETGKVEGGVSFDPKDGDLPGPLNIGVVLTREHKDEAGKPRPQRIALFGDSDFLSDANIATLGNKQFALNILQWLASRDAQLNIDVPKAPDTVLRLPGWAFWVIGAGYTAGLPLLLLGFGVLRWLVRRRQ